LTTERRRSETPPLHWRLGHLAGFGVEFYVDVHLVAGSEKSPVT